MASDGDDHPVIEFMKSYATDPQDETIDGLAASFARLDDPSRTNCLQRMTTWVVGDGVSPRQRSQLWNLQRRMDSIHHSLRKVGR